MKRQFKKLTTIFLDKEKQAFLSGLQELGLVHLEINEQAQHEEVEEAIHYRNQIAGVIKTIELSSVKGQSPIKGLDLDEVVKRVVSTESAIDTFEQEIETNYKSLEKLEPWGEYEYDRFKGLILQGYHVFLCSAPNKTLEQLDLSSLYHQFIDVTKHNSYFVVFSKSEKLDYGFDYFLLPAQDPQDLALSIEDAKKKIDELRDSLSRYRSYLPILNEAYEKASDQLELIQTVHALNPQSDHQVAIISGWFPSDKDKRLKQFLGSVNVAYQIREAYEEENPPVELKNNAFVKLFEPITKIFELPNYHELDLTPFIAVFYPILFAYCLGDAGYGFVLTAIMLGGYFSFFKDNRSAAVLGVLLGLFTTVMGLIKSGSLFGIPLLESEDSAFLSYLGQFVLIPDDSEFLFNAFNVALMIGVVQILTGIIISIYNRIVYQKSLTAISAFGKLLIVVSLLWIFLADMQGVTALDFLGSLKTIMLVLGILLVVFFHQVDIPIGQRVTGAFMPLFFIVTGILGDILSYVRLFALGLASSVLGLVVNQIGEQIMSGGVFAIILGIVFLLFGHTLNFFIAALGSFVHPLRLTFVEFYGNANFLGKGVVYKPFHKSNNQAIKI